MLSVDRSLQKHKNRMSAIAGIDTTTHDRFSFFAGAAL